MELGTLALDFIHFALDNSSADERYPVRKIKAEQKEFIYTPRWAALGGTLP